MIDVKLLRENPEKVKKGIAAKKSDPKLVDKFLASDGEWRELVQKMEKLRAEQKKISGQRDVEAGKKNKELIREIEAQITEVEKAREAAHLKIPNLPSEDTPIGVSEKDNKVLRKIGEPSKLDFEPRDHVTLGEALGIINTESAGKISGTRFAYLMGDAVKLEFALVQFALETLTNPETIQKIADSVRPGHNARPFIPVVPPVMIKPEIFQKMGRLDPKEERYYIPTDDVYLVGSAEHTLGPLHMDETVSEAALPIRYIGFSTSFRREAGSYGKDTKGILRLHQFDKLELESFSVPEFSVDEQNFFVAIQEYLMTSLAIPYRVVSICTGDMGGPDARQIDIEAWMPGQNEYRETHTADLMTDYQSRRLGTRVKRKNGEVEFIHMNDATAFAIGRTIIAIMENYQTKEGKIKVPKALQKYVGKEIIG